VIDCWTLSNHKPKYYCSESNTMDIKDRENAVLASFLYADDMGTDKTDAFKLEEKAFTSSYRRATANKINDETANAKEYGYLSITIEGLTEGTEFEQDWINILAQTPLPFSMAKRIHNDLIVEFNNRIAKGLR